MLAFSMPNQFVRICNAAINAEMDISETVFWGGGEPFTEQKAEVLTRSGCRSVVGYAMAESGYITHGCGNPSEPDDMHLLRDKLAVLSRPRHIGVDVQALFHTTLLTSSPKIMLNVESGDFGVMEERDCGCLWQSLGLRTHLHHVRSYQKLTGEGVMFMGSVLHDLMEQVLPAKFGGGPLDYQLVEEEEQGLTRETLVVSPRIGLVDEMALIAEVLRYLGFSDWSRRQADLWRQNGTLRVRRGEPYQTSGGKILTLHVRPSAGTDGRP